MVKRRTRRELLAAAGIGIAGLAVGCGTARPSPLLPDERAAVEAATATPRDRTQDAPAATATAPATASPTSAPTATPTPRPAGHEVRALLPGTAWETTASIRATGVDGPTLVVLGGVHGNEPGGWLAADQVVDLMPTAGVLITVPHANVRAIAVFERLVEDEGDVNRSYPGSSDSEVPMERMGAEIVALSREFGAEVLLDLHESWAHYVDRTDSVGGTAYLGQTITGGVGPRSSIAGQLAEVVNATFTSERERLVPRDGRPFRRDAGSGRGRSSLSLGGHVPGLTPVLVEMAQQDTPVERRVEMHLAVVRAAIGLLQMNA